MNSRAVSPALSARLGSGLFVALLVVHFACGLHTAWTKNVTHDEIWHLPVGLLHWRTGRFDQDVLNPPLTRLWAAIPAALAGVPVEGGHDATDIAQKFVRDHDDFQTWYFWGRVFNLGCSLATAWIVYAWGGEWFGRTGGLLAAAFYCGCPNIVAHSSLVTPDAGLMLGFTAVLWQFVRWRRVPTWRRAVALGVVLGLVQTAKFTAVLLYPLLAVLMLFVRPPALQPRRLRIACGQVGAIVAVSLFCWNAVFLFHGTGRPLRDFKAESRTLRTIQQLSGPLAAWPVPLPQDYMAGIDRQKAVMEQAHPIFLDGVWNTTGFRDYFLRTLEYKLPHLLQFAVLAGLLTLLFSRADGLRFQKLATLLLPTAGLLAVASFSSMQLGVRYVLPVLPLLMLGAGGLGPVLERISSGQRRVVLAAAVLVPLTSLRRHPHHLAYFNEWAGGPVGGRQHLLDSNLDWGQDLYLVREFMREHELPEIGLVYFGTLPAERLGIDYHISPGRTPAPGWHAVSVNYVMGRPHLLREPDGTGRPADIFEFAYFQAFEPVARLGYSIDVYFIPDEVRGP